MALLNHQSYHQFLAPQKRSVQVFKFLKFVYQGIRFVGGWWLRCWACWFTKLLLLPMYLSCIFTYILYHRSSCGHPFRIPDFYGFLGLATNMTTHARSVRAGGTNILRQGNKLDRTVCYQNLGEKALKQSRSCFFSDINLSWPVNLINPLLRLCFSCGYLVVNLLSSSSNPRVVGVTAANSFLDPYWWPDWQPWLWVWRNCLARFACNA